MDILLQIFLVLIVARAFGEGAARFGQSASVGELLSGVALAAMVAAVGADVPVLSGLRSSEALGYVAQLGIFFLVLLAGIEMEPSQIARASGAAFAVALGGMAVPLCGGMALGWLLLPDSDLRFTLALVIGVSMAITAIPATAKILSDFGLLHSRLGELIISAALFDDVMGLLLLAVLTALLQTGHAPDLAALAWLAGKAVAFFALTVALGMHVYPRISRGIRELQAAELELSAMVAVALGYGWLAELAGMHWIVGAFMAGLYFEKERVGQQTFDDLRLIIAALAGGLLGPLFFAWVGLQVDLRALVTAPLFLAALVAVAFFGKVIGAGLPARWSGHGRRESLAVGVGMAARGEMELVVLGIVLEAGLFARADDSPLVAGLFSILVLMALINTVLTPIVLRRILGREHARRAE